MDSTVRVPLVSRLDASNRKSNQSDTVGEFPKQRTYAFYPGEFKDLTRLRLNSPTVSSPPKANAEACSYLLRKSEACLILFGETLIYAAAGERLEKFRKAAANRLEFS